MNTEHRGPKLPPRLADKSRRIGVIAPEDWLRAIDTWRKHQPSPPNISEAIRVLVLKGIEADSKARKGKAKVKPE
jgi:hypothetical protein